MCVPPPYRRSTTRPTVVSTALKSLSNPPISHPSVLKFATATRSPWCSSCSAVCADAATRRMAGAMLPLLSNSSRMSIAWSSCEQYRIGCSTPLSFTRKSSFSRWSMPLVPSVTWASTRTSDTPVRNTVSCAHSATASPSASHPARFMFYSVCTIPPAPSAIMTLYYAKPHHSPDSLRRRRPGSNRPAAAHRSPESPGPGHHDLGRLSPHPRRRLGRPQTRPHPQAVQGRAGRRGLLRPALRHHPPQTLRPLRQPADRPRRPRKGRPVLRRFL